MEQRVSSFPWSKSGEEHAAHSEGGRSGVFVHSLPLLRSTRVQVMCHASMRLMQGFVQSPSSFFSPPHNTLWAVHHINKCNKIQKVPGTFPVACQCIQMPSKLFFSLCAVFSIEPSALFLSIVRLSSESSLTASDLNAERCGRFAAVRLTKRQ